MPACDGLTSGGRCQQKAGHGVKSGGHLTHATCGHPFWDVSPDTPISDRQPCVDCEGHSGGPAPATSFNALSSMASLRSCCRRPRTPCHALVLPDAPPAATGPACPPVHRETASPAGIQMPLKFKSSFATSLRHRSLHKYGDRRKGRRIRGAKAWALVSEAGARVEAVCPAALPSLD